jgi:uncharacterized protein (TIGR00106 family)
MRVAVDLCIVPLEASVPVSVYITACERVLAAAGLTARLHIYGAKVEGEWDEVFAAVRRCHEVVHGMGASRISTTMIIETRVDRAPASEGDGAGAVRSTTC